MRVPLSGRRLAVVAVIALVVGGAELGLLSAVGAAEVARSDLEPAKRSLRADPGDWFLGKRVDLARLRTQRVVVVINFWQLGCRPCVKEAEAFERLRANDAYDAIVRVGVANLARNAAELPRWAKAHRKGFRGHVHDRRRLIRDAFDDAKPPSTYVLNADGTTAASISGPATSEWLTDALEGAIKSGT